jgi:ribosomal protein S18 acetylase RimI-like enzyme
METNITLRWLRPTDSDLAALAEQLNSADSEVSLKSFSAESLRDFLADDRRFYLVAHRGKELAGAVHGYKLLHPAGVNYWYIDEVDTIATHRRHGVGTAMMREVFRLAETEHADEVWLGTERENDGAKAFYLSLKPTEIENGPIYSWKVKK